MADTLSKPTWVFGLSVWIIAGIVIGAAIVLILFAISLWFICKRQNEPTTPTHAAKSNISKPTTAQISSKKVTVPNDPIRSQVQSDPLVNPGKLDIPIEGQALLVLPTRGGGCKEQEVVEETTAGGLVRGSGMGIGPTQVSHLGWGHWYTLRELDHATNGFADGNVIGEGGFGIVYYGVLVDNTQIAVKNLLNNRGQAEKEFKVEVEAIGRVRHKCLVRLIGYCAEGAYRILVYEYVNNGNLEQWLHGEVGPCSPLTWDIRMKIILGTAKGLTYLHEGLDPKVVHRDIKSSNILLDKKWNPKVSDFGLAKLLGPDDSYITTRVMGTYGYVAPEYASTGMLTERSDVFSFGILVMEIISGRDPVDYSKAPGEVNLVDWFRAMIASRNPEGVLDPKMQEKPASRALKMVLLIALRCVDPNALKRPKMGHVVHMLEAEDPSFRDDQRPGTNQGRSGASFISSQGNKQQTMK